MMLMMMNKTFPNMPKDSIFSDNDDHIIKDISNVNDDE